MPPISSFYEHSFFEIIFMKFQREKGHRGMAKFFAIFLVFKTPENFAFSLKETECTPYMLLGAFLLYLGCLGLETCCDFWVLREYELDIIREQSILQNTLSRDSFKHPRTRNLIAKSALSLHLVHFDCTTFILEYLGLKLYFVAN